MTLEYFWEVGHQDAKKVMENPTEQDYENVIAKIDNIKETHDEECATAYAYGLLSVLRTKEKTR